MSNEVRELKEHIRLLEDEAGSLDHIEEQLDAIQDALGKVGNSLSGMCDMFERVCVVLKDQNDAQKILVEALQGIGSAIKEAAAKQSAAPAMPSVFDQLLNDLTKRPKRQKFKPKVVDSDEPEPQPAA